MVELRDTQSGPLRLQSSEQYVELCMLRIISTEPLQSLTVWPPSGVTLIYPGRAG